MKKLHVKQGDKWVLVFCHAGGVIITTEDKAKALPQKAIWANDDLQYFQSKFSSKEFCLK